MEHTPGSRREGRDSEGPGPPGRRHRLLLLSFLSILTVVFVALGGRLFYIQVVKHDRFLERGRRMWTGIDHIPATRGDIVTRDGSLLARSVLSYEVGLDPSFLASEESAVRAVRLVARELELPAEVRREVLRATLRARAGGRRYVRLARRVTAAAVERLRGVFEKELSTTERRALRSITSSHRVYPRGEFLSQVLGTTDVDGRGIEGVERTMDAFLSEEEGKRVVIRGAIPRLRLIAPEQGDVSPVDGYRVVLTIDSRLQRILEEELREGIEKHRAEAGVGIIMSVRNGDVLAMASFPAYDPNAYHEYPSEERARRRRNRAIENVFEPGSVLKPFFASRALQEGLTHRDEPIWKGGSFHVLRRGSSRRGVSDVRDHGPLTMEEVVVHSSNIGMSILGLRLGRERIIDTLESFGFVRRSGIHLPGEAEGRRTDRRDWKELYSSVSVAFGYEVMVTPLQLATAFTALVNGGYLYRPRIVERVARGGKELLNPPELAGRPIDPILSQKMRDILLRVVEEGTGRHLRLEGFRFGGKSGTADMGPVYRKEDYLSSFEAFAPFDDPEIVVLVMIEKPRGDSIYGSIVSGPVVAAVLRRHFRVEAEIALGSLRQ